jgi:hypothetical protein
MDKLKWIVLSKYLNGEKEPAWWETDENNISTPVTYDTSREAYLEIVSVLQWRIETFLKDDSMEYLDINEDTVVPCTVTPDGIVRTKYGEVFSPFKPQETYGR